MIDSQCLSALSPSEARQIDHACDRFEAAWKAGPRPRPEEYLETAADSVRLALLRQLLLLDWDYRRRAGDEPGVADYQGRFPNDSALIEDVSREISESPVSTQVGPDASVARHTPWSDHRTSEFPEALGTDTATGSARYELLGEVGQGGIGVVFRGRDRLLGRELAVKVLREAYQDRPEARHRFIEEARVGSRLQHPAIVPVYELGWFEDRRPFITMKLVQGHTLAALLKERADPSQDLPRFLGVFEQVCHAMAYAHKQAVVHRDLKPANIMVGAFGEVQVMDWGFARMLDEKVGPSGAAAAEQGLDALPSHPLGKRSGTTVSGTMMGTPAYMPPEQARGEAAVVDRRSDVFALGAILCEILTGRPPYAGSSVDEICRQAAEGDLHEAHARLDSCTADGALRALAQRSIAAERELRPLDAGVMASAMTTHFASAQERLRQVQLAGAAAEARAAAAQSRVKAERRARRLTLALAAALLCGVTVTAWQAILATNAKTAALISADKEKEAKEVAEVKEAESKAVLDFVQLRVLVAARPEAWPGGLGYDVTLRRALKAAQVAADKSFANQPLVEARVRHTLGVSFLALGEWDVAARQFLRARAIYTDRLGPDHPDTLGSMNDLATSYVYLGRLTEALKLFDETLALRQVKLGPEHPDTLRTMAHLANCYNELRRYADALQLHEATLALRKAHLGPEHPETFDSMTRLANSYAGLGRQADALKLREETLALQKVKLGVDHSDTLNSMNNLANSYTSLRRYADAVSLHLETLALRQVTLGPEHPDTVRSMSNLANCYALLGRYHEALPIREQALAIRKDKLGIDHPDTLNSMWRVASNLIKLDRGVEAVPILDECLRLARGKTVHPVMVPDLVDLRLRHFEKAKDAEGCRATAQLWENLQRSDAASLYQAAVCRAITAAALNAAPGTATSLLSQQEADQAMAWLQKSVAAGYVDVAKLGMDKDLAALRDRADFKKLLEALAGAPPKG